LRLWTTADSDRTAAAIGLYRAFGFVQQRTCYAYYGYPVEIFSFGLAGPGEPLDSADIASHLAGADRHKLTALAGSDPQAPESRSRI
jgi:ribosomal protein S18 acetylase RimI-like enzyme